MLSRSGRLRLWGAECNRVAYGELFARDGRRGSEVVDWDDDGGRVCVLEHADESGHVVVL